MVAYFPFSGNANDTSGNGHDGTVFGATLTEDRFGNPDSAYNFDGDDYIDIPFSPQIEPDIFSLSLWFNTTNTDNPWFGNTMISTDPDSFGCLHGYEIVVRDGGRVLFGLDPTSSCGDGNGVSSDDLLSDGAWHHVVAIYDSSLKLYIDGNLQSDIVNDALYPKTNVSIRIGMTRNRNNDNRFFLGSIDDFRIYNRVLSDDEIQELFNGSPGVRTHLLKSHLIGV
ncbi:LamG domain-containing protein [Candidatus Entotheonella palauensis]|uniref:LamG domain-containing protein n=1 Tax=Candidatus Entotheonella palauensis TaxID=93172 RepID=UPI0015C46939|nr:LamG domain-containing protein [Candidatus Entotheonella palauensis]